MNQIWDSETIIADTLRRGPELDRSSDAHGWRFSRWRQFVGSYALPALPNPLFVVQLAGKTDVRIWDRDGWSDSCSFPGAATIVPAGRPTRWLVDGELDVVTFSLDRHGASYQNGLAGRFNALRFAYSDPLAAALSQQILGELVRRDESAMPQEAGQSSHYLSCLIDTLRQHITSGPINSGGMRYRTSGFSSYRVHRIIDAMLADPAAEHSLAELAQQAGITEAHLCRVFKHAVGRSPHQYLIDIRLDRARELLASGALPMSRVAEKSGFAGQSQFARAFRHRFGETPSSFRRRSTPAALPG